MIYVNRTLFQNARNGTTSHTITYAAATAGNLLLAYAGGGVTLTTPTGWTLVNSSVSAAGIYAWKKTATAGETSTGAMTANGSNYPIGGCVWEFSSGSTVDSSVTSGGTGQASTAANPSITPTSAQIAIAVAYYDNLGSGGAAWTSLTWSAGTEEFDLYTAFSSTDGYLTAGTSIQGAGAAFAPTTTPNTGSGTFRQSMSFALTNTTTAFMPHRPATWQQAVNRSYTY